MPGKPKNPYPDFYRRVFKKILPTRYYGKFIGRHEHGSLHLWQQIASRLNPDAAILDIGAFQGEYAIAARRANQLASIYAFEPNPRSLAVLQKNVPA